MASSVFSFNPTTIRACASSDQRKPDTNSRKNQSSNWWSPLFDLSSDTDYIEKNNVSEKPQNQSESDSETTRSRSRFAPGCFTEEKAKQLRLKTLETSTFHDIMYHSAIASRLASDLSNRSHQ